MFNITVLIEKVIYRHELTFLHLEKASKCMFTPFLHLEKVPRRDEYNFLHMEKALYTDVNYFLHVEMHLCQFAE